MRYVQGSTSKPVFSSRFRDACVTIAEHVYGPKGIWAYEAFHFINDRYFGGRLPHPFILWEITPHGACLGATMSPRGPAGVEVITLHPSLLGGTELRRPWGLPAEWLGPSFAFDVLLHECIHLHIDRNLGGTKGATSHNCDRWVHQVNRLAPLIGLGHVNADRSKSLRVPDESQPRKPNGKYPTRVVRGTDGDIPFSAVAGFPEALRRHRGEASRHYSRQARPSGAPQFG